MDRNSSSSNQNSKITQKIIYHNFVPAFVSFVDQCVKFVGENICGQISKDFNKLTDVQEVNVEALQFGLFVLHAETHFFETLLYVTYKLLKNGRREHRKQAIQKDFSKEMRLIVDVPKPGFENTNDGNTSQKFLANTFFRNSGINDDLIKRFRLILEVLSSGNFVG